jgi:hypothetical protein
MNDKVLIYSIFALLGIGMLGVLFVVVPWVFNRGFSDWKQVLIDDGLILMALALFVYGFYMNTKIH